MGALHDIVRWLSENRPVWFLIVLLFSGGFGLFAFWARRKESPALQILLLIAAVWLVWLPIATGGQTFTIFNPMHGPTRVLPVIGSYVSFGAAFICCRVAASLPKQLLKISAVTGSLLIGLWFVSEVLMVLSYWQ